MANLIKWIVIIVVALVSYEVIGGYLGYATLSDVYTEFTKDGGTVSIDRVYLKPQGTLISDGGTINLSQSNPIQTVGVNFNVDAPQTLSSSKWSWVMVEGSRTFPPDPYVAIPLASGEVDFFDMFSKDKTLSYQYEWTENKSGATYLLGLTLILYNSNSVETYRDYYDINVYLEAIT